MPIHGLWDCLNESNIQALRYWLSTYLWDSHCNDVIMGAIASQITTSRLFTQAFIQTQIKENIKAPRHWPLCGEFTGDRWIPRTNDQLRGKCFRLMTSWWTIAIFHSDRVCSESHLYTETIWIHLFYTHIADFFVRDISILQKNPRDRLNYIHIW